MIWKKLKKLIIPLIIVKFLIVIFFIFSNDLINISREINYTNYQEGFENNNIVPEKQHFIRIVRNEEERGILIKLRAKKDNKHLREKAKEILVPVED
jgi:hypothetical protein